MTYSTSQLNVDGAWRNLLIITSDTSVDWSGQTEIVHEMQTEEGVIRIYYYTEGLYKTIEQDGQFKYWFLYDSTRMTVDGESEELRELKQAFQILTEGETDELH